MAVLAEPGAEAELAAAGEALAAGDVAHGTGELRGQLAARMRATGAVFTYDADAGALYYPLTSEPVARTVSIGDRVMVDVDAAGEAVGIEVLAAPGFSVVELTGAQAGAWDELCERPARDLPGLRALAERPSPFEPILPVPVDDPGASRPEPRRWTYPLADPCRGSVRVPYHGDGSPERFAGDYGGGRWVPLGVTGYDVRCWADGADGDEDGSFPVARVQYRPNDSPTLPEEFVRGEA